MLDRRFWPSVHPSLGAPDRTPLLRATAEPNPLAPRRCSESAAAASDHIEQLQCLMDDLAFAGSSTGADLLRNHCIVTVRLGMPHARTSNSSVKFYWDGEQRPKREGTFNTAEFPDGSAP